MTIIGILYLAVVSIALRMFFKLPNEHVIGPFPVKYSFEYL